MLISKSLIKNDHNLPKYNAMGILVSDLFVLYTQVWQNGCLLPICSY